MTNHNEDFPFEEIRDENEDYFDSVAECTHAGYSKNQIWSVTENEDTITYGPWRHWVNLLGYVCTKERHDNETYYNYDTSQDREPEDQAELTDREVELLMIGAIMN